MPETGLTLHRSEDQEGRRGHAPGDPRRYEGNLDCLRSGRDEHVVRAQQVPLCSRAAVYGNSARSGLKPVIVDVVALNHREFPVARPYTGSASAGDEALGYTGDVRDEHSPILAVCLSKLNTWACSLETNVRFGYRARMILHRVQQRLVGRRPRVDPRGPVFISYRRSDGRLLAIEVAWALRAAGVPVWRDQDDLPPGDTRRRLGEALGSGISGAVLLVTPEVGDSDVIRRIELPRLFELARSDGFTFSIASTIESKPGELDYNAPDRLLRRRSNQLRNMNQQPVRTARERADLARSQARRRIDAIKSEIQASGSVLLIDVQTRIPPFAARADADLVLRLRPPLEGDRRPNRDGLEDLKHFLADLPELSARAGAEHTRVRGGAHLSVAFALGAALPTTLMGRVEVIDTEGQSWSLDGNAQPGLAPLLAEVSHADGESPQGPVAVFLDLLPTRSDAAFERFATSHAGHLASVAHFRPVRDGSLAAEEAAVLVGEAAQRIRELAGERRTADLHLLLRCPWTVALLLGRTLNTLRVRLYEWEDGPADDGSAAEARYLPSLVVRSGSGGSPIEQVVLPARPVI